MSLKLKILGLGVLAVMATSAFTVMNASANGTGGHFVSEVDHTILTGSESATHALHLTAVGSEGIIGCTKPTYTGTTTSKTVESVTITPKYESCHTTPGPTPVVTVTPKSCTYTFTVTEKTDPTTQQEVHLLCNPGDEIEVHHPNCTIVITPQTVQNAVKYENVLEGGKHTVTATVNAKFKTHYHGGICIFLGTAHEGELKGSVTLKGADTEGNPVSVTAT